ncbi:MAG: hypothetical protein CM1200mP18_02470 [Gammaproteobacteria bacterium]|nr:MAG: hypothetical protein CM1200mP18_02470 [Gammaproteobacteria bacterium]
MQFLEILKELKGNPLGCSWDLFSIIYLALLFMGYRKGVLSKVRK